MAEVALLPPSSSEDRITVQRPVFDEQQFDERFVYTRLVGLSASRSAWIRVKKASSNFYHRQKPSRSCMSAKIQRFLPIIRSLRTYNIRIMLLSDIIAGITAAIMHVPQGMAYGMLAAVGPVEGLYTSFFPPLVYGLFASSRHVSYGTFAVTSMMMASVVTNNLEAAKTILRAGDSHQHSNFSNGLLAANNSTTNDNPNFEHHAVVHIATSSCLACGLIMLVGGVLRLGCLSSYLSDDLIGGFSSGAAVHILTSQLKTVFGVSAGHYSGWLSLFKVYRDIIEQASHFNYYTVGLSLICITLLLVVKIYINGNRRIMKAMGNIPVPIELILVAATTLLSFVLHFDSKPISIKTVGPIPIGLPAPTLPRLDIMRLVFNECISIAIVAFCMTISIGRMFALKYGYHVSASAELRALGLSNFVCSFFSCMPSSGGLARSLVVANVGGFTQVATFISCVQLLFVLLFVGPLLSPLPTAVLASIIIVALRPMFIQFGDLKRLAHISLVDASIWLVTFIVCILFDVSTGLFAGIVYALFTVVLRSQHPSVSPLGRIRGTELYKPLGDYNECDETPGVRVVRIDSPIYFANIEHCRVKLMAIAKVNCYEDDDDHENQDSISIIPPSTIANDDQMLARSSCLSIMASSTSSDHVQLTERRDSNDSFNNRQQQSALHLSPQNLLTGGMFTPESSAAVFDDSNALIVQENGSTRNGTTTPSSQTNGFLSSPDVFNSQPKLRTPHSTTFTGECNGKTQTTSTTAAHVAAELEHCVDAIMARQIKKPTRFLVIDCTRMSFIDTSGVALLLGFLGSCKRAEVGVVFASCSNSVRDMLQSCFANQRDLFFDSSCWRFVSVHDAVVYATDELHRYRQARLH